MFTVLQTKTEKFRIYLLIYLKNKPITQITSLWKTTYLKKI